MLAQGITYEDIVDVQGLKEAVATTGNPLLIDPRDYVINEELYYAMLEVSASPHEIPFLWNYQRWEYQKPIGIGLSVLTILVLITKELTDANNG